MQFLGWYNDKESVLLNCLPYYNLYIAIVPYKMLNYNTLLLSCRRQITLSNIDKICPPAIQNHISLIPMHIPSLVKIPWHLHKLPSRNKNMGMSRADNSIKIWPNLPISNPKSDLHNINAHTKFGENRSMFTRYHPETKYGWTTDGRTDPLTFNMKP